MIGTLAGAAAGAAVLLWLGWPRWPRWQVVAIVTTTLSFRALVPWPLPWQ